MGRRYGRTDITRDFRAAASRSVDAAWGQWRADQGLPPCELDPVSEQTEHEQRVGDDLAPLLAMSLEQLDPTWPGLVGYDPNCRFRNHPAHECVNRDGQPRRLGSDCYVEARLQVVGS